ncbi:MAG: periplasmic heavy metal sensor [Pseudomonadota bacterium]
MTAKTRILLYASLALNLLVVGAVAGAVLFGDGRRSSDGREGRGARPFDGPIVVGFARGLDRETRRALGRRLAQDPALRAQRDALAAGRLALASTARADPFDADALRAAFSAQQDAQAGLIALGLDALVETIATLSPEEREAFAASLEKRRGLRRD